MGRWLYGQFGRSSSLANPLHITMQTFELLTGRWLFSPQAGQTWRMEDDHLAKMMDLTGETFSNATLSAGRKYNEYFDQEGYYDFLVSNVMANGRCMQANCVVFISCFHCLLSR